MARKTKVRVDMSPSPHAESSGNESAEQQLFAESQASPQVSRQPPTTVAIRSAHLLNAARIEKLRPASHSPSSSPLQTTTASIPARTSDRMDPRNVGASKLKRPSFIRGDLVKTSRQNLARRGDIYEIDLESPQKDSGAPYQLLETVNRSKPLKRVKKSEKAGIHTSEPEASAHPSSPPSAQPMRIVEDNRPPSQGTRSVSLSSPRPARDAVHEVETGPRKSGRLAGKSAGISHVDFGEKAAPLPSKKERLKRKAAVRMSTPDRLPKSPRREDQDIPEPTIMQAAIEEQNSNHSDPGVVVPKSKSRTRADAKAPMPGDSGQVPDQPEGHVDGGTRKPMNHQDNATTEQKPAKRGRGRPPRASRNPSTRPMPADRELENGIGGRNSTKGTRSTARLVKPTSSVATDPARLGEDPTEGELLEESDWESDQNAAGGHDHDDGLQQNHQDTESEGEQSDSNQREVEKLSTGSAFEQVFAFSESERRRGRCQSNEASLIKHWCRSAKAMLKLPATTFKEAYTSLQQLQAMLSDYGVDSDTGERTLLKVDAYGYLFRELVAYLVQLHGWLEQYHGEVAGSSQSMRVLFALAQAIVSFKDTIASWKVPLPPRYKNDRLVKIVDVKLIAPLRRVVSSYRISLDELIAADRARKMRNELEKKKEEAQEEERRKEISRNLRKDRWNRWQDLHVWRQQCEPDPLRRRRLFMSPDLFAARFEVSDERDANGIKFERIPLFKERDSPPHQASSVPEEEWTDRRMTALIEGLTNFAGPDVFRKIFRHYCQPGGALRDLTVPELTAQAVSIRSTLLAQYQGNNWAVPEWITQIPILP